MLQVFWQELGHRLARQVFNGQANRIADGSAKQAAAQRNLQSIFRERARVCHCPRVASLTWPPPASLPSLHVQVTSLDAMLIPKFWAEGRLHIERADAKSGVVRRWGWSNESLAAAEAHGVRRAEQAWAARSSGENVPARESRENYSDNGVPIREEVLGSEGEALITRNAYGARCLNTENVLFVDLDDEEVRTPWKVSITCFMLWCAAATWVTYPVLRWWATAAAVLAWLMLGQSALHALWRRAHLLPREHSWLRLHRFIQAHPEWHLRVYETPAGLRALAMHRTFSPREPAVEEAFEALNADKLYRRLCRVQQCFRARVSAKPWRIPGTSIGRMARNKWPVTGDALERRNAWIQQYERAASTVAACRYVGSLGTSGSCAHALAVQDVHDRLCRAQESLPLA